MGLMIFVLIATAGSLKAGAQRSGKECIELLWSIHQRPAPHISQDYIDDPKTIQPGEKIWVKPGFFYFTPKLKAKALPWTQIKLIQHHYGKSLKRPWKKWKDLSLVELPNGKKIMVPRYWFSGDAFRSSTPENNPRFTTREIVEFGRKNDPHFHIQYPQYSGSKTNEIPKTSLIIAVAQIGLGYFIRQDLDPRYHQLAVTVQPDPLDLRILAIKVPRHEVYPLRRNDPIKSMEDLLTLRAKLPRLVFQQGEKVRFRDRYGLMQSGIYVRSLENGEDLILDQYRYEQTISRRKVFKKMGIGEVKSISIDFTKIDRRDLPLDFKVEGNYELLLNAAAHLNSTESFKNASRTAQLKILNLLIAEFMDHTELHPELFGFTKMDNFLTAGIGCCRHKTPVLAAILSEMGYKPRIKKFAFTDETGKRQAHMWLEVEMPDERGNIQTYIVDPNMGPTAEPMWKIRKLAAADKKSPAAIWYTQPGAELVEVLPLTR